MQRTRMIAALVLALPLLAGCYENDPLNAPDLSTSNGLMARYVSMGNSITAGYQSAGINDSTQQRSYAVLFAGRANAPFFVPSLQGRGCAPPLTNNVTETRVGGGTASTCDLRADERLFYVSNVAVPGATSFSPNDNMIAFANSNALTTFILGGRTQVQAMFDADPTFVTAWIGNNDILGSLTSSSNPGNPALVTPQPVFEANYAGMLDSIEATGAAATLISVADVSVIPYASRTAIYYCLTYVDVARCQAPLPTTPDPNLAGLQALGLWNVDVNCAAPAGLATLIPWTKALPMLAAAAGGSPQTMDCSVDSMVVTPTELTGLQNAVAGFNGYISAQAAARGMAYLDVNPPLLALVATGDIPAIPDIAPALAGQSVTFGPYFTLDGVHPSTLAHQLVADSLVSKVNSFFGTDIP
jgi:lysophospholipase L1-like esterase